MDQSRKQDSSKRGEESTKANLFQIHIKDIDEESRGFLVDDYKLKVDYLTAHFDRLWTRFNFFLTIELAIFGFLGYLLFDTEGRDLQAVPVPFILGIGVSLVWFIVGRQDRALVNDYRSDLRGIAATLSNLFQGLNWYKDYYVGSGKGAPEPCLPEEECQSWLGCFDRWLFWRYWKAVSITRLPAILPLILVLVWGIIWLMWRTEFWVFCECYRQDMPPPSPP